MFFNKPFDNFSSLTLDKCHYIIRYENIIEDYTEMYEITSIDQLQPKNDEILFVKFKDCWAYKDCVDCQALYTCKGIAFSFFFRLSS